MKKRRHGEIVKNIFVKGVRIAVLVHPGDKD
jgi:hypothetical protein